MNWEFWSEHWFLAWCALWLGWGIFWIAAIVISTASKLTNRILRSINIAIRGWPPAHLDADGDWKPEPEQQEQA